MRFPPAGVGMRSVAVPLTVAVAAAFVVGAVVPPHANHGAGFEGVLAVVVTTVLVVASALLMLAADRRRAAARELRASMAHESATVLDAVATIRRELEAWNEAGGIAFVEGRRSEPLPPRALAVLADVPEPARAELFRRAPWVVPPTAPRRTPTTASISVVIPTLNDAPNLAHVLTRIPSIVDEVVVVDGHSTDATIAIARGVRPDVRVVLQDGRGKANALACGFAAASCDIIVMLDADGSTDPAEIPRFVATLLDGKDFATGSRFMHAGGSSDPILTRGIGNRILSLAVNLLFRTRYTDITYGFAAFWRHCLPHIQVTSSGGGINALLNVSAARAGLAVTEVPSVENKRRERASGLSAIRDGGHLLNVLIEARLRVLPDEHSPGTPSMDIAELPFIQRVMSDHSASAHVDRPANA